MFIIINNYQSPYKKYFLPLKNFLISYKKTNKSFDYIIISDFKQFEQFLNLNNKTIKGIIISGSNNSVINSSFQDFSLNLRIINHYSNKCPILTICFGTQLIASLYGSSVKTMKNKIEGNHLTNITLKNYKLFDNLDKKNFNPNYNFNDKILELPFSFKETSYIKYNNSKIITSFFEPIKSIHCFLFHPEHKKNTEIILINFINKCL